MKRSLSLIFFFSLRMSAQTPAWAATETLPNVDMHGMSAAQKAAALRILREESCTCGCTMKLAQCRMEDPKCAVSKGLAAKTVQSVREGKSVAEIREMLAAGPGPRPVLDDAVSLVTEGSPVKGPATARITFVEFSDFECPYCSQAVLQLEAIQKAFPNDVKLVFKQFPLAALHPHATLAAQAALAAHAQGKFWPMHDRMFANHTNLTRENLLAWARELGCDMPKFLATMDSPKTKALIARDLQQGETAGVEGTPTIFVNGKHYNGSFDLQPFSEILRGELNHK